MGGVEQKHLWVSTIFETISFRIKNVPRQDIEINPMKK